MVVGVLTACSPALNWRKVTVAQLAAQLPCKPDQAQRDVELAGARRTIAMWGCEANGALYAVSYVQLESPADVERVAAAWQEAAIRKIAGAAAQPLPWKAPSARGSADATTATLLQATATAADSQPLQARWAWLTRGDTVYHLAVFAPELTASHTDPFLLELQWQ